MISHSVAASSTFADSTTITTTEDGNDSLEGSSIDMSLDGEEELDHDGDERAGGETEEDIQENGDKRADSCSPSANIGGKAGGTQNNGGDEQKNQVHADDLAADSSERTEADASAAAPGEMGTDQDPGVSGAVAGGGGDGATDAFLQDHEP